MAFGSSVTSWAVRYESHTKRVGEHVGEDASITFGIDPESSHIIHRGIKKTIETLLELRNAGFGWLEV